MSRRSLQVEWINVTYASVVWMLGIVLFLSMAGAGSWFYLVRYAPKEGARSAIEQARVRLAEARRSGSDERLVELLASADQSLNQARSEFSEQQYQDAAVAAMRSQSLSMKAITMSNGAGGERRDVSVHLVEGDVRIKPAGKFSWESVEAGMILHVGDQVKTSSSASVQLIYFDRTITTIQPGSLLEIRDLFEDPVTKVRRVKEKLTWGEVRASTQKRNVSGSYHEVTTDKVAARADDVGEFRVVFDKEKKTTDVAVFDGRIDVSSKGSRATIDAGEQILAQSDGRLGPKKALPGVPRLLTPSDQRVFISLKPEEERLNLSWQAVPGSKAYRLVIADGPLFTSPLYDSLRTGTTAEIQGVASGSYHWRVAAISKDGSEGPFGTPRRFRVSSERIRDRTDTDPPRLEITEFVPVGTMVIINGETEPGATLWVDNEKIEVYDDGSFSAVVKLRKEGHNKLVLVAQDTAGNEQRVERAAYVNDF